MSRKYNLKVEFIENEKYATTNTSKSVLNVLNNTDSANNGFYLIDGDLVFNKSILWSICTYPYSCAIISRNNPLLKNVNDNEAVRVKINNKHNITSIGKNIGTGIAESVGLYKISKETINEGSLKNMLDKSADQEYYEDSFQHSIDNGFNFKMGVIDITGYENCMEIDTPDDYITINKTI